MQHLYLLGTILLTLCFTFAGQPGSIAQTTDACAGGCPKPNDISVFDVSQDSATISWSTADTVQSVMVTVYLLTDSSVAFSGSSDMGTIDVSGLTACSGYGVELMSDCGDETSDPTDWIIFKADGCCRTPSGIRIAERRDTTVTVIWDEVVTAMGYRTRIRPTGAADSAWDVFESLVIGYSFAELEECSAYDVQVRTICEDGALTDWSSTILVQTTDCGVCEESAYCIARGADATRSWIDSISFANLRLQTGSDGGYFFYSAEQTALERGRSYNLFIETGFVDDACEHYVGAWIDLDQDGMFNDSTEVIVNTIDEDGSGVAAQLTLADTLVRGITRFRVISVPRPEGDTIGITACGSFDFGEVEDYCIRIDEPCPAPENIDTVFLGEKEATLIWDRMPNAFGYLYTNTEVGETEGDFEFTGDTMVEFSDLKRCTEYIFRLTSVCQQDSNTTQFFYMTKCETSVADLSPILESALVFPNPVTDVLNVEFTPIEDIDGVMQVVSLSGQVLYSEVIEERAGNRVNRQLSQFTDVAEGIYFLVISTPDGVFTRKIVKARY